MALATLLVALLAVYGENLRRWLFRPRVGVLVDDGVPFVEIYERDTEKSATTVEAALRIKVVNRGHFTAKSCQCVVEKIYSRRASTDIMYPRSEFMPKSFTWHNEETTCNLFPNVPAYITVMRIAERELPASQTHNSSSSPVYSLFLLVRAESRADFVELGIGRHIFPVTIYGDNLSKPVKHYIEVVWSGGTPKDASPANIIIKVYDQGHGEKLVGGEK